MTVSAADVLRLAALAEIALEERDLPALTEQIDRIVGFVAQLGEVSTAADLPLRPGPSAALLRDDTVVPTHMMPGLEECAPDLRDGLFVVPRVPGHEAGKPA